MNVIIATFQYDNYGTRLQNFALCYTIIKLGAKPVTLALGGGLDDIKRWIKNVLAIFPLCCYRQRKWINERNKRLVFQNFNRKLNIKKFRNCSYGEIGVDTIAIVGSDQIWSPAHISRRSQDTELYFLRFVPKEKRFAYAPSFGVEKIPNELVDKYRRFIDEFHMLSIRELSGKIIVQELIGRDVLVMPDPVFLLSKEEWRKVASESGETPPRNNYLLTYFLSEQSGNLWANIRQYAHEKGLKIIRVAGNRYIKGEIVPAPDEFVGLIDGAQAVFTDSFHGSAFSIILQIPFAVFKRADVDQFTRVENLLSKHELNCAFVEDENSDFDTIFQRENFSRAESTIKAEIHKGLDYLKQILKS